MGDESENVGGTKGRAGKPPGPVALARMESIRREIAQFKEGRTLESLCELHRMHGDRSFTPGKIEAAVDLLVERGLAVVTVRHRGVFVRLTDAGLAAGNPTGEGPAR